MQALKSQVDASLRRLEIYMEQQVAKDAHAVSAGSEWQEALHAHRVKLEISTLCQIKLLRVRKAWQCNAMQEGSVWSLKCSSGFVGLRRINGRMRSYESRLDGVESELVSEKTNSLQALDAILQHAKKV